MLSAALAVFLAEGAEALTFKRLSEETGVARSTIYRHWPDRAALVATMFERATEPMAAAQSGEVRPDLVAALRTLCWRFEHKPVRPFLTALLGYAGSAGGSGLSGDAYVRELLAPIRAALVAAVAAGALDGDVDRLTAELAGPLVLRHVLLGEPILEQDADGEVDRFLRLRGDATHYR